MMDVAELTKLYFEDFGRFSEFMEGLARAGLIEYRVINREHKYIELKGAIATSLYAGVDPINTLVLLALTLYGPRWISSPQAERAFKEINRWWREKVKAAKGRSS